MAAIIGLSAGGLHLAGIPQVDAGSSAFGRLTRVDRDCADFATQAEAQKFFLSQGPGDPHGLDADHDGRAC
jgi:Excalibur calcium-binding domain